MPTDEETLILVAKLSREVGQIAQLCQRVTEICEDFEEKYKQIVANHEARLRGLEKP